MGDKLGEAKSSGNLGNTLKVMGKFDEAMICCKRHLEISRELNDKVCLIHGDFSVSHQSVYNQYVETPQNLRRALAFYVVLWIYYFFDAFSVVLDSAGVQFHDWH